MQTDVDLFLCLSMAWYHYDDRLLMYSKPRGASTSERASEVCIPCGDLEYA